RRPPISSLFPYTTSSDLRAHRAARGHRWIIFHSMTNGLTATLLPADIGDEINARILAVAEDRIAGFLEDPFAEIARQSGVSEERSEEHTSELQSLAYLVC